jgi:hypothetical protein
MAMTWDEIMKAKGIDKIAAVKEMLAEKGMTLEEFLASEEGKRAAIEGARERFTRPPTYTVESKTEEKK